MTQNPTEVLIVGGGVAGLETLLALRALAGDRVRISMLAPEPDFVYRPLATAEPFLVGRVSPRPLRQIADDHDATLIADGLAEVLPAAKQVRCTSGAVLTYDVLVVALGAVAERVAHASSFSGDNARETMAGVVADLEEGYSHSVAFVAPAAGWTLPLYELALLTARAIWDMGMDHTRMTLITPESRPLELFGDYASSAVAELLAAQRIDFIGATEAEIRQGVVVLGPGGDRLQADRIVSLPRLRGPAVTGLPADAEGFIPVDAHGLVVGLEDVYAAGDATDHEIKQGGLATQQADAVAELIAQRAGADVDPQPFHPVLRGLLLTGERDHYLLNAGAEAGGFEGHSDEHPLWWPPSKISGRYLAPYLFDGTDSALRDLARVGPHIDVETALPLPTGIG